MTINASRTVATPHMRKTRDHCDQYQTQLIQSLPHHIQPATSPAVSQLRTPPDSPTIQPYLSKLMYAVEKYGDNMWRKPNSENNYEGCRP